MIFMHHADCYCEPIVEDMVEMGIDIWQGVIPQNDIVSIQRRTHGELAMIGGIDAQKIDVEHTTSDEVREEIHRAYDTYLPAGRFYPAIPGGRCFIPRIQETAVAEMHSYGHEWAQKHPIGPDSLPVK